MPKRILIAEDEASVRTAVRTMFEDKLNTSLTKILGIAAVVPKSDGVGKLLGHIQSLLDT